MENGKIFLDYKYKRRKNKIKQIWIMEKTYKVIYMREGKIDLKDIMEMENLTT